jgi:Protein of unknown function (DUF1203)
MSLRFVPLPAPLPDVVTLPPAAVRHVVATVPDAYPCRRCLRDAEPGDLLLLLPYDPFVDTSPYRQPGPVYVHADACRPDPADLVSTPDRPAPGQLTRRRLALRAFDADHMMVDAEIIDGTAVADAAARLLAHPRARYVHVHNAAPGCFAVRVERA